MPVLLAGDVGIMNTELNAADPALLGNDGLLAAVLSGSGDCIKILDLDGRLQFMSEGGKRVMEVDDFNALKGCPWPDFWEGEGNTAARQAIADARAGKAVRFLGAANTARGTPKFWDVQVLPILDADGRATHLLSISKDITELKTADATIKRLVAEALNAAELEAEKIGRLLKSATSIMCVVTGPDHVFELVNDAFVKLVGTRDLVGHPARAVLSDLEGQGYFEPLDLVYSTGEAFHGRGFKIEVQPTPSDPIRQMFVDFVFQPIINDDGAVTGIFVQGNDVTQQTLAAQALKESELRVKLAMSAAELGIWECTFSDGYFTDLLRDERARILLGGREGVAPSFENFLANVHPDEREAIIPAARAALDPAGNGLLDLEYRVQRVGDTHDHWVHARAQVIRDGGAVRLIGTVRDITNRKDFDARQQVLSGELQHRIKNTLAMVSAIAAQTLRGEDIAERRAVFNSRLDALARAHTMLMGNTWSTTSICDVVNGALAPHRAGEESFKIIGPPLDLSSKQSMSLALTIHELATNAAKYGALSVAGGSVDVEWSVDGLDAAGAPAFTFKWTEQGGPIVQQPERKGFGTRLITRVLASDFDGDVRIDYYPSGVVCVLISPLTSVMAGDLQNTTLLSDQVTL